MKTAGLTLLATLLLAAVATPAASAVEFEATSPPGSLAGYDESGYGQIITEAGSIECEFVAHSGTFEGKFFTTAWLHAEFEGCKAFGFLNATVDTESCDFAYTPTSYFALYADASLAIDCESWLTESIKATAATCAIEIPENEANLSLESVTIYHGGGSILLQPKVAGIHYVVTNDGFLCPFNGKGEREDGEWVSEEATQITASEGTIDIVE